MLKKIGIPVVALLALAAIISPAPAKAEVHFGVGVYAAPPVYAYPAPAYPEYYYDAPYTYTYPAPAYGYYRGYYGGHGYYRHYDRDDYRHYYRGNDRNYGERGRGNYNRDHRR